MAAPTSAEVAAALQAEQRGAEMYAYDQAAWHATDRFQEDLRGKATTMEALIAAGLKGYAVEPGQAGRLQVTFYGERDGRRFAMARYEVDGNSFVQGGFVPADGERGLSLLLSRIIDAREKAIAAMAKPGYELCTESPPNTIALPPQRDGSLPVYIMTSTVEANMYPAGGHFRFDFDADGKLIGQRRFMNSCFNLDYSPKNGVKPEVLFLTHLLDLQPTEIHSFVSRYLPLPLGIITVGNRAIWEVDKGRITYSQDVPDNN